MDSVEAHASRMRVDTLFVTTTELIVRDAATVGGGIAVGRECQLPSTVYRKSFACVSHNSFSWTSNGGLALGSLSW